METLVKANDIECDGCANAIKNALGRLDGVESIKVDVQGKEVRIQHSQQIGRAEIEAAMDKAGFPVSD
jgi:copper chaperone